MNSKKAAKAVGVEPIVRCGWINCDKPATVHIIRASVAVCDDHYIANVIRFGCEFEIVPANID